MVGEILGKCRCEYCEILTQKHFMINFVLNYSVPDF